MDGTSYLPEYCGKNQNIRKRKTYCKIVKMNTIESKMKEENEIIKELFAFNGDETQHLKQVFLTFIQNSNNGSKYFILLLEHYSLCRPYHHNSSIELVECIYSCFPKQFNEIQKYIKNASILKFIIFPEKFPIKNN